MKTNNTTVNELVKKATVEEAVNAALTNKNENLTFTVKRLPIGVNTKRQVMISFYENHYGESGVCVECDGAVDHIPTSSKHSDEVKRIAGKINLDYFNVLPEE